MIRYTDLNEKFITDRFPELAELVSIETEGFDEFLPHVVFANVFNGLAVSFLKLESYRQSDTLKRIFDMYEELASQGDEETKNLVQVTLLEYLWDESITYERAKELMGESTQELWAQIDYLKAP
ncbi:hypothetical protein RASY3_10440 [Ruminococcus albus SY3]|uniref:DUF7674 domain-containing protein n=2 Tax=Ruminococcus albus TaxID=1264 RepID=A0A011UZW3_RUMAL|nr:hypothetical protein RASY3_19130 [Ruminococcus albus SY3]EXM39119.1 hypothetical protein RASY3_10440 [Ruminococcus albus SY3]